MAIFPGQFIGLQHSSAGRVRFRAEDAAGGLPLEPMFINASEDEIHAACELAGREARRFRAVPLEGRAAFLERVADELDAAEADFVERMPAETGLPEARVRGELARTTGQLRLFAATVRAGDFLGARIDHGDPRRKPAPKPDLRQYNIPLGPVAVFGASNFPLAFSVCGGDTASAWAAGCPVVVKAHPGHPGTSAIAAEAVVRAMRGSEIPEGAFSLLHGSDNAVGEALVRHPAIRAVGFTGSCRGGLALTRIAGERAEPIPVFTEMGSVNPQFFLPVALASRTEVIADAFVESLTLAAGQFCTNPGLVFAPAGASLERFLGDIAERLARYPAGVMLNSAVLNGYLHARDRLAAIDGVHRVAEGGTGKGRGTPVVYRTDLRTFRTKPVLAEEVFGPCALVVEVPTTADYPGVLRALPGQLTATVHGEADELAASAALVEAMEQRAGRLLFNGMPTGVEVTHAMTHGGPYPATGDGRSTSVGTRAIERFLRPVTYQNFPDEALPEPLREANPLGLRRLVDGVME